MAFPPIAFLASRLAVLIPRARVNLVLYHGVLAPLASGWREVVPRSPAPEAAATAEETIPGQVPTRVSRGWRRADLMRRVFEIDVLSCPGCGGRLHLAVVSTLGSGRVESLADLLRAFNCRRGGPHVA